jgi:GNAT superfamily N-acetyltransferase
MGNDAPLPPDVLGRMAAGLAALPTTRVLIAYEGDEPVGIATCFVGFSTFRARPLLNIHDLFVRADRRGRGIGKALLGAAAARAAGLGCCRLTLEVSERNERARRVYEGVGFAQVGLGTPGGGVLFYSKVLPGG